MSRPAIVRIVPRRFGQPDGGDIVPMILAMTEASVQRWNRLIDDLGTALEVGDTPRVVEVSRELCGG